MAPSCKIELARFSAGLRKQDGAECGNMVLGVDLKDYGCVGVVGCGWVLLAPNLLICFALTIEFVPGSGTKLGNE